ncbi:MAG: hypothetical protein LVR00_05215 [Rhabdochlamydiaceae bacterium]|jgi:hypothetical protein
MEPAPLSAHSATTLQPFGANSQMSSTDKRVLQIARSLLQQGAVSDPEKAAPLSTLVTHLAYMVGDSPTMKREVILALLSLGIQVTPRTGEWTVGVDFKRQPPSGDEPASLTNDELATSIAQAEEVGFLTQEEAEMPFNAPDIRAICFNIQAETEESDSTIQLSELMQKAPFGKVSVQKLVLALYVLGYPIFNEGEDKLKWTVNLKLQR